MFGKVAAISGGGANLTLEHAYLEDALSCASFSVDHPISQSDFLSDTTAVPGMRLVRSRANGDARLLTFALRDVTLDRSAELDSDFGPVTISGTITLRITIHVSGSVSWNKVTHFEASETTTVSSDLRASVTKGVGFDKEIARHKWGLGELQGFTVMAGPVPIYFQPEISVFIGAKGQFEAGVRDFSPL